MGVWSFVKDAGKKLLGGGAAEAAEAPEAALKKEIEDLGLDASGLDLKVEGDTVRVAGAVDSTSIREKIILTVGNALGVSKVEEAIEVKKAEPEATFYTVEKGDTLWKIAATHYGNGSKYPAIFEANTSEAPLLTHCEGTESPLRHAA